MNDATTEEPLKWRWLARLIGMKPPPKATVVDEAQIDNLFEWLCVMAREHGEALWAFGVVFSIARDLKGSRAQVAALRAIIEGRTTPPPGAERAAHTAAGGRWRHEWPATETPERWWPIDREGRSCAWPVVP